MKNYDPHTNWQIKTYKCATKAKFANTRFKEDLITKHDVLNLLIRFNFKCVYCSKTIQTKSWQLDHFYSKAMGGKNKIENLAPACNWCNQMKGALDGFAFLHRCKNIVENNVILGLFGDPYLLNS